MTTTRCTLLALPILLAACASSPRSTPPATARNVDIVHGGTSTPASRPSPAALGEFDPFLNDIVRRNDAVPPRVTTSPAETRPPHVARTPARGRSTLIGLYGEIAPQTESESDPYDGNRNLTQVTFADEGACFDPDIDPTGRWLVFASTRHRQTADLYVKASTGSTITQITSDPADDLMPSFDPLGQRIAFATNRDGNWNIYLTGMQGGRDVQLTSGAEDELHPTWSPDGRQIAFCKLGAQSGRWEIWVVDVEAPGTQRFLDYGLFPRWSPDVAHSRILFQRSRQRGSRYHGIWTIDYVNGEALYPTEIASAANAAIINPTWSPDGRRIAFVTIVDPDAEHGTPGESDVWIVSADGSGRTMLTNGDFANFQPVWASTGTIYFVSNRSGNENIWAVGAGAPGPSGSEQDDSIANVDPGAMGPPSRP